jgi:hypothetical protein
MGVESMAFIRMKTKKISKKENKNYNTRLS